MAATTGELKHASESKRAQAWQLSIAARARELEHACSRDTRHPSPTRVGPHSRWRQGRHATRLVLSCGLGGRSDGSEGNQDSLAPAWAHAVAGRRGVRAHAVRARAVFHSSHDIEACQVFGFDFWCVRQCWCSANGRRCGACVRLLVCTHMQTYTRAVGESRTFITDMRRVTPPFILASISSFVAYPIFFHCPGFSCSACTHARSDAGRISLPSSLRVRTAPPLADTQPRFQMRATARTGRPCVSAAGDSGERCAHGGKCQQPAAADLVSAVLAGARPRPGRIACAV